MRRKMLKVVAMVGILNFMIYGCSNGPENQRTTPKANKTIENTEEQKNHKDSVEYSRIDYDLTNMSSEMVYALVYQMMTSPDDYIDKTIKMSGIYYAGYDEATGKYYHYVIIKDATACCAQGLEFVWGDGKHIYPDEYPKDETEVEVVGVFETYKEGGDSGVYCRLKKSQMKLLNK